MRALNIKAENYHTILRRLLEGDVILLDVRTNHEFVGFHLPNAHNIPTDGLQFHLNRIKNWNKPIIVYSTYGLRSKLAYHILKNEGIEVYDAGPQSRVMSLLKEFQPS